MTTAGSRYLETRPRGRHARSSGRGAFACRDARETRRADETVGPRTDLRRFMLLAVPQISPPPRFFCCRRPAARQQLRAQLRAAAMTSQERFSVHSQLEHLQAKYVGTGHADTTKLCAPQTADRVQPFACALPPVLTVAVDHWWQ